MTSFTIDAKAQTFLTIKLGRPVDETVSNDELRANGYEYDWDNYMCEYCSQPAVCKWTREGYKMTHSEYNCVDHYREYGTNYEGWTETDCDQDLIIYRQGEQEEIEQWMINNNKKEHKDD